MSARHDAEQFLSEMDKKYIALVAALLHKGSIFDFIDIHQLHKLKADLTKKLPSNIKIMDHPEEDIGITIEHQQISIHGYLNLVESSQFDLILATAIPNKIEDSRYTAISTDNQLFAIDYNKQEYFVMTIEDLHQCNIVGHLKYACSPSAVYNIETREHCIIDALFQRKEQHVCPMKEFKIKKMLWKKLAMKNTWLAIANEPTNGAITCNGIREDINFDGIMIIKIKDACIITTKRVSLRGERKISIKVKSTFLKPLETAVDKNVTLVTNNSYAPIEPILDVSDSFFAVTEEPESILRHHTQHKLQLIQQHTISMTVTLTIMIGIYCIYKRWSRGFTQHAKKDLAPRADIELV
jgi:hypothetical protein